MDPVSEVILATDPEAHRMITRLSRKVGKEQYRIIRMPGADCHHLIRTNPGALAWAMHFQRAPQDTRHPGQLIAAVRREMTQGGLDDRNWKKAVSTPPEIMKALLWNTPDRRQAAIALNALTESGASPGTELMIQARAIAGNRRATRHHTHLALKLIFQESGRRLTEAPGDQPQRELVQELRDVMDYLLWMDRQERTAESRTWRGLLRRSRQWHQRMNRERDQRATEEMLRRQRGMLKAWNSLIGETMELDGLTVQHLGSQRELLKEAQLMEHCVDSYWEQCSQGTSRIFSIRRNDETMATGEIMLGNQGWTAAQTRGRRNAPPGPEAQNAMEQVAIGYNQAWTGPQDHRVWWEETGV